MTKDKVSPLALAIQKAIQGGDLTLGQLKLLKAKIPKLDRHECRTLTGGQSGALFVFAEQNQIPIPGFND